MRKHLAIFDLDGTLFDTRAVNFCAYQQALREEGYDFDRAFFESRCDGGHYRDFLPLIVGEAAGELVERIHRRKKELYPDFLFHSVVNEHLFRLIGLMRGAYHIALVTTASRANCLDILERHQKTPLFELILAQEDVAAVKPDPEGFQKAMAHFGIERAHTLIFEDSPAGLEAAKRCGAGVLAVHVFN
jgi:beta-phosphoglucomutase